MNKLLFFALLLVAGWISSCTNPSGNTTADNIQIDSTDIDYFLGTLASDDFMGRKPFTEGETKTVNFLVDEFKKMGLAPGNGDSYIQEVPLVEITGQPALTMTLKGPGGSEEINIGKKLGNETAFPKWKEGSEFKAIREKSLKPKG
ncbi:MAG: hypothetical protein AAF705_02440 [Bacteroidota bacterium]